jgi:nucleoside-diphosphate-sugar epimerase
MILVTGGTGLVGAHLPLIESRSIGRKIRAIYHLKASKNKVAI